jgi:hypothetical protein
MKKIIVVFALLLSLSAIAQDFPGKRPELLLGKEVKVLPLSKEKLKEGYVGFYTDDELYKKYKQNGSFNKTYEDLVGKSFKVLAVDQLERFGEKLHRIKLQDVSSETVLYYKYDDHSEILNTYSLEVKGGLDFPADYYKDFIEIKTDKFTKEKTFVYEKLYLLKLTKSQKGKVIKYTLMIEAAPRDNDVGKGKGASILLENNKRIDKPLQLVKVCDNHYCATFELTQADLNLLKANKITDFRVNKYDEELTPLQAQRFKGVLNYMIAN